MRFPMPSFEVNLTTEETISFKQRRIKDWMVKDAMFAEMGGSQSYHRVKKSKQSGLYTGTCCCYPFGAGR